MNCKDAEICMMKYMDGDISEGEAKDLNAHLLVCSECKESFFLYEAMLDELDELPMYQVPMNFDTEVLTKISEISQEDLHQKSFFRNKLWGNVWGTFAVIFGSGAVISVYRVPIMHSLSQYPFLYERIVSLAPIENKIAEQGYVLQAMGNDFLITFEHILSNSMGIILGILAVVCGLQCYVLYRKQRKE